MIKNRYKFLLKKFSHGSKTETENTIAIIEKLKAENDYYELNRFQVTDSDS